MSSVKSSDLISLIAGFMALLKPNDKAQDRKNLRLASKTLKKIIKRWSKDGLDELELKLINEMKVALAEKYKELG